MPTVLLAVLDSKFLEDLIRCGASFPCTPRRELVGINLDSFTVKRSLSKKFVAFKSVTVLY